MLNSAQAITMLSQLEALRIWLDDFGTGYSLRSYLSQLPVAKIKIDKSFVMNMVKNENDAVMVHFTIDLVRNLGLRVIGEGVETEEAWRRLADLDCDLGQGYLLSRPVPADSIAQHSQRSPRVVLPPPLLRPRRLRATTPAVRACRRRRS